MEGPSKSCTWIGPEQDPLRDYPIHYCGQKSIEGFSYCAEHYHRVYEKGSATTGSARLSKMIDKELADLELQKLIAEQEADLEV